MTLVRLRDDIQLKDFGSRLFNGRTLGKGKELFKSPTANLGEMVTISANGFAPFDFGLHSQIKSRYHDAETMIVN